MALEIQYSTATTGIKMTPGRSPFLDVVFIVVALAMLGGGALLFERFVTTGHGTNPLAALVLVLSGLGWLVTAIASITRRPGPRTTESGSVAVG